MARKTLTKQNQQLLDRIESLESQLQISQELSAQRLQKLTDQEKVIAAAKAELADAHADEVKTQKRLREALGEVGRLAAERDRFAVEIARQVTTAKD